MSPPPRVLFLPGAAGRADFWQPVADRLPATWVKIRVNWPGGGDEPHDPDVRGFEDLVSRAAARLGPRPTDVVAQSLGGIVAIGLALRHPRAIRRLVLVATSGGVDAPAPAPAAQVDWRAAYRAEYPHAAAWITDDRPDQTPQLRSITAPALLLWGDRDPVSPPRVGRSLAELLPHARLHVIPTDDHGFAEAQPCVVAPLIAAHIDPRTSSIGP